MSRYWPGKARIARTHRRGGFLCVGAFREILMISFGVGFVLTMLWQASQFFQSHLSAQQNRFNANSTPILGLYVDRDQDSLLAVSWPGIVKSISLESGVTSVQPTSKDVVMAVASPRNSTVAMLAEWTEDNQLHHRVDILRRDELILSEELIFEPPASGCVSISSDGNIVMLFSFEGEVYGWDLTESQPRRWQIKMNNSSARCQMSPDGSQFLVAPLHGRLTLCHARTGTPRTALPEFETNCRSIDWSNDSKLLAIGDDVGGLHVFDSETGTRIWYDQIMFEFAHSVAFSNDGRRLAVGGFDETIRVWDITTKAKQAPVELKGQAGVIRCLTFTPSDETLVSGSLNGSIHEWSIAEKKTIRQFH